MIHEWSNSGGGGRCAERNARCLCACICMYVRWDVPRCVYIRALARPGVGKRVSAPLTG